jgi:hypothetical protein
MVYLRFQSLSPAGLLIDGVEIGSDRHHGSMPRCR